MDRPKRDEIYEVTIDDIGAEGSGIGRIGGEFVVFVPGTVPGDKVKAIIKKTKKNFAQSNLESIVSPSENRVEPECEYFSSCNGCKMQNINYSKQLEIKRKIVLDSFERIGGFSDIEIPGVLGSENIYFYRNKLEFSFSNDRWLTDKDMDSPIADKTFALGYHIPGFIDKILDIRKCYLQSDVSSRILNFTRVYFKERNTSIYSSKIHSGYLRFLVIRQSANTSDLMVNLITFSEEPELIREYSEGLKREVPEVSTIINAISTSRAQVANAETQNVVYGKGFIEEIIGKYKFKITPGSFFQTNSKQCEKLFEQIVKLGDFTNDEHLLDLYCGCGAISLYVSGLVKSVHGVELSRESIEMADTNASINGVTNCSFMAMDVKDYLAVLSSPETEIPEGKLINKFDTFILDPPRSGIHPKAAEYILKYKPKKIIYVSCNPATQARDLQLLSGKYSISSVQPVDMFPHTFHIENVVRLDLKIDYLV